MLPFDDATFDAVVVDPPYYDAYPVRGPLRSSSCLAEKKRRSALPRPVSRRPSRRKAGGDRNQADKKSDEYVSHEEFDARLAARVVGRSHRVTKADGLVSIVFAHTDVEAWSGFCVHSEASISSVTTSWPMRSERGIAIHSSKSAPSLGLPSYLVCRRQSPEDRDSMTTSFASLKCGSRNDLIGSTRWQLVGADYFVSAVGPASRYLPSTAGRAPLR